VTDSPVSIWPWLKIGGGVLIALFVAMAAMAWMQEHDARLTAEAVEAAQQQVINGAQKTIDAAKADAAKTASDLQTRLAAIEAKKQQPVTAPQFVLDLSKVIPNLPQPARVVEVPAETKTVNGETKHIPAETAVQIPAADLQALQTYKLDCDATGTKLSACEQIAADRVAELEAGKAQLAAVTKERDAYKQAAKGGSFLHRVGKQLKCIAASSGAAALGAAIDSNKPERGALIGAAAGGVGCQLF
jgi:hypothetical protein